MDLTTVARVKTRAGGFPNSTEDARLTQLVHAVSERFTRECERVFQTISIVEIFDVRCGKRVFALSGYPHVSIIDVRYDATRPPVWGTDTILSRPYAVDAQLGLLGFDTPWTVDLDQVLRVSYVGGIANNIDDADDFVASFPEIADALDEQVMAEYGRAKNPGVTSLAVAGGSIVTPTSSGWVKSAQDMIDLLRRKASYG